MTLYSAAILECHVMGTGHDSQASQTVHTRSTYHYDIELMP